MGASTPNRSWPANRVGMVEIRYARSGRVPAVGLVVLHGGVEAGVADQLRRDLVIEHVIDRRRRDDDSGIDAPQQGGHPPARIIVEDDRQIVKIQAGVAERARASPRLPLPPRGVSRRSPPPQDSGALVAGGNSGAVNLKAALREAQQRPGAKYLNMIRMRHQRRRASVLLHYSSLTNLRHAVECEGFGFCKQPVS